MNNLQIFKNERFGIIRNINLNGEPYFVGKDVAEALGYLNTRQALSSHVDKDDKTTVQIQDTGSNYKSNAVVINESGLYSLILSSKLPKAKEFKHWVTSEVLPSIRITGSYGQLDIDKIIGMTVSETMKQLLPFLQMKSSETYSDDGGTVEEIVVRKRTRRKPAGIIEKLDPELRKTVDNMICSPQYTYKDIMEMLNDGGISITQTSISRYAKRFF